MVVGILIIFVLIVIGLYANHSGVKENNPKRANGVTGKSISPIDYSFAEDPEVCKFFKTIDRTSYEEHAEMISELTRPNGYGTFEQFLEMFNKSDFIKHDHVTDMGNFKFGTNEEKNIVNDSARIIFDNKRMVMKTKRDWELYHKFMIWTILQKRESVDWGELSGCKKVPEKKTHTSVIFNIDVAEPTPFGSFIERLETLEHRCKVFDTISKSTVLFSIKDGSARIREIIKCLSKEDITDGLLTKLDDTIKTMEDALKQIEEKIKKENAERIITALDLEEKVIEKVQVMNG